MKKYLPSLVFGLVVLFVAAKAVSANEGVFHLVGPSESGGSCYAASVYIDGSYKILMTCRGLRMALDPVRNKYVVWANAGEKKQRLGEIVNGKLSASIPAEFDTLFVTLEPDAYSSKPSGIVALTGNVETIDFGQGAFDSGLTPSVTPVISVAPLDDRGAVVPSVTPGASGRLTNVVVGIGKAILFGFILLLIVVGVMSFLARRKNL
ncbi:MAG: hypothetical protein WAV56_04855 [Microgenomates group bacterium]